MIIAFSAFEIDPKRRTLTCQGKRVTLLSRPFDILLFLIQSRDRIVSREEMQAAIWPGQILTANNMTVQISLLRRVLAQHGGGEMIITVPGRGYRFVGDVVEREEGAPAAAASPVSPPKVDPAPLPASAPARPLHFAKTMVGARTAGMVFAGVAVAAAAILYKSSGDSFAAYVQVETVPDTIAMVPNGYCKVDYVFRVLDPTDLQLATEDVRLSLTSGEPIGQTSLGGRIYHGSFPIQGRGTGVYHNNIWLPPEVADEVRARHRDDLYVRHTFHLIDPHGAEITAPAILKIVIGAPQDACTVPKSR